MLFHCTSYELRMKRGDENREQMIRKKVVAYVRMLFRNSLGESYKNR
jgi:hypothetical protein